MKKKKLKIRKSRPTPPSPPPPRVVAVVPLREQTWCGCVIEGEWHGRERQNTRVTKFCGRFHPGPYHPVYDAKGRLRKPARLKKRRRT